MNYCINCRYFVGNKKKNDEAVHVVMVKRGESSCYRNPEPKCSHPKVLSRIDGSVKLLCEDVRGNEEMCGDAGKWFEVDFSSEELEKSKSHQEWLQEIEKSREFQKWLKETKEAKSYQEFLQKTNHRLTPSMQEWLMKSAAGAMGSGWFKLFPSVSYE